MEASMLIKVVQEGIYTIIIVSLPILITGLIVGAIVSVFQATTQINDQTLSFVPKIIAIFIALIVFGEWMMTKLVDFTSKIFEYMNTMVK